MLEENVTKKKKKKLHLKNQNSAPLSLGLSKKVVYKSCHAKKDIPSLYLVVCSCIEIFVVVPLFQTTPQLFQFKASYINKKLTVQTLVAYQGTIGESILAREIKTFLHKRNHPVRKTKLFNLLHFRCTQVSYGYKAIQGLN